MIRELGEDYTAALRKAWPEVPGGVDLVCYWFAKAWSMIVSGRAKRAGLVATNSIRGGANREVLKPIVEHGRIFEAWSDEDWTVEGAAVRISMICFDGKQGGPALLNGRSVEKVNPDLTGGGLGTDLTRAKRLPENADVCFEGMKKYGDFDISGEQAREWLRQPLNVNGRPNADVLFPWIVALDVVRRPLDRWAIDFGTHPSLDEAAAYQAPFEHVREHVYPYRQTVRRERTKTRWWVYEEARVGLRRSLEGFDRYIATPVVAKHRIFVWLPASARPSNLIDAIARDDDTTFGILHSRFHELWALRMGTFLGVGNDPRYTPSTTFETFPFPDGLTPDIPAADYASDPRAQKIAAAAARLNELREAWLNPPDLVVRVPEVVPGYPAASSPRTTKPRRSSGSAPSPTSTTRVPNGWRTPTPRSTRRWPRPTAGATTGAPARSPTTKSSPASSASTRSAPHNPAPLRRQGPRPGLELQRKHGHARVGAVSRA
jgi:type II restriction/modification system DNA methylase subunit YeeA